MATMKGDASSTEAPSFEEKVKDDKKGEGATTSEDKAVGKEVPRITQPTRFDVLLGRGKPYQGHAGNIRLHKVVDLYKPRYSQARRHEKTEIAEEIVQFVKTPGGASKPAGRFLKRVENEELWVEVSDSIARDKVSHALRGKPRKESGANKGLKAGSGGVIDELLSAKRGVAGASSLLGGGPAGVGGPPQKRQKLQGFSDFDMFSGRQHGGGAAAFLGGGNGGPNSAAMAEMMQQHQQQLFASALAERQLAAGLAPPFMGMGGFFGQPSVAAGASFRHAMGMSPAGSGPGGGGAGDMNPLLLQQLAAERQLRSDPRLWM